jgi:hypothetical protein
LDVVERVRAAIGDGLDVSDVVVASLRSFGPGTALSNVFSPEATVVRVPDLKEFAVLHRSRTAG